MLSQLCVFEHVLQFAAAVFAALAAWKWFMSSRGKIPDHAKYDNIDQMYASIARQSRLNAHAASFAGIAALLQLSQVFMPSCWSGAPWFG
jgi:hypothetical protein